MRIGVISDTHGRAIAVQQAVKAVGTVDMWLHAGDNSQDIRFFQGLTDVPVVAVAGNCDGYTKAKIDEYIKVEELKIWLTHGHRYDVKYGSQELIRCARDIGADIVVYGHSHIPDITWEGGLLLFNPGSAGFPRGNPPSCGVLTIKEGKVEAEIIDIH